MARQEVEANDAAIDPLWYKDAIIYQIHVRAFADSDNDGIGDFRGLTSKLDYLQELGVTAVWVLPFYPSPLRDDGYDIADFTAVNPSYGTIQDVRTFVREAHNRGLKVITELVCNHTSDQHPWFQRARHAKPGSSNRDFYVWSDTTEKYKDARIIFQDFESSNWTWDPVAGAYYWHRFYSHQPDLNFENPQVQKAIFRAMDFWMNMGVDGLRLDAIPYLYEEEGTNCENLPETHVFLKQLRQRVEDKFQGRMFLAEANQWPEDAVAYFGDGDECQMAFHFPVMPRLYMSVHMEDRYPIIDIMHQTPAIPDNCQWAIFLRNHDELTLEMVTDEERDYMYRVYAKDRQARINLGIRRRLSPLLGNHRRKIELMNGLLLSLPGTPVMYYGDEIGMGDNIYLGDRNGVRTPMQWSGDRNAGFSRANPQQLFLPVITDPEYHYEMVNVENQNNNQHSLLWWTKRLIALRKRYKAFGRGTLEFLHPENRKVLAFVRAYEDENILVLANLSRFVQGVELDLSAYRGMMLVEMFGQVEFPAVGELPYFITMAPHSFYWFALVPQRVEGMRYDTPPEEQQLPMVEITGPNWDKVFQAPNKAALERILPEYMQARRWFGGKARKIKSATLREVVPVPYNDTTAYLTIVSVEYTQGNNETYMLPMAFSRGDRVEQLTRDWRYTVLTLLRIKPGADAGVIYDPLLDREFCSALLDVVVGRRHVRGNAGELVGTNTRALRPLLAQADGALDATPVRAEQSNSSVIFGNTLIMKLFRKLDEGLNPDLEIGRFLTENREFANTPPIAGSLEYVSGKNEPVALAIVQGFVPNEGDAWKYTLDVLANFFDRLLSSPGVEAPSVPNTTVALLDAAVGETPSEADEFIAGYLESARLLGQRTGEMHVALTTGPMDSAFAPEAFSTLYQRSLFQSMRTHSIQVLETLGKNMKNLPASVQGEAQQVLDQQDELLERFKMLTDHKFLAMRARHHGDYHLGQVLFTGRDFMIIDFEGEPARVLSERRIKRSPLRDVAGMLRSFQYAVYSSLFSRIEDGAVSHDDIGRLHGWANFWYFWVCTTFLKGYLEAVGEASFLPQDREDIRVLLEAYILEKAIYEIGYEMGNRPAWLTIPLQGVLRIIEDNKKH